MSNVTSVAERLREPNARVGLTRLLEGYRLVFGAAMLTQACAVAMETASAFALRSAVDSALASHEQAPTGTLSIFAVAAGLVLIFALGRGLFSYLSGRGCARVSEGIAREVREALFDHLQRLPFRYHDTMRTGELIQRATSDVDSVRRFYGEMVPGIARIGFLFVVNFVAVATIDLRLALLSSLVVPAVAAASVYFFIKIFAAYEDYQDKDAKASTVLQENVTGVRVVKAFARQAYEIDKFEATNAARYADGKLLVFLHALYWPVSHALCAAQTLAGWFLAAFMVADGELSLGTFVAYTSMLGGLIWPLQNLGRLVAQLSTSAVSYGRISEILRQEREVMGDEAPPREPATTVGRSATPARKRPAGHIVFEDVWFAYGGERNGSDEETHWALRSVSFEALPGQRVALLGAPGSGKSTLVNLIPRFYEPTRGRILLDGIPLDEYSKASLRELVGVVEQQPFLFSMTIRDNIAYGAKRTLDDAEVERAAAAAAIHDSIAAFPEGYATMVGERGVTLSGGQKQRVAIARTLVKDPALLILDDSTSAVDAETEDEIRAAMDRTMGNRTTFVVAHKVRTVMDADLILVFRDGSIVERGDHSALMAAGGFYRRAFDLQTKVEEDLEKELRHERSVS